MNIYHTPRCVEYSTKKFPDYHTFMGILELMTVVTIYYDGDLGYRAMKACNCNNRTETCCVSEYSCGASGAPQDCGPSEADAS